MFNEKERSGEFLPVQEVGRKLAVDERVLTEVDHLLAARRGPDEFAAAVLEDVQQNLVTAVQEAAMPYAVTTTRHEIVHDQETRRRTFRWLGKTAVQTAMSGYQYHYHPNAIKRVDVEVDEARFASETLRPGIAQVFISPRMSRKDASLDDARREHLGDDDAVRVSWLEGAQGADQCRVLQSLLVRDVPLEAWVRMLADPDNIFGKSIAVEDEASALSVMKAHRELEIETDKLPKGPVTILEEVVRHIEDGPTRQKVEAQISKYYGDQKLMKQQAEFKATQWLEFERELAESLAQGSPTSQIKGFIASLQSVWNETELEVISRHSLGYDLEYVMTRELAVVLEKMKQNTLWGGAAVLSGNTAVVRQIHSGELTQIRHNEEAMFIAYSQGQDVSALMAQNSRLIGGANIKVGGGCAGTNDRSHEFDPTRPFDPMRQEQKPSDAAAPDNWESNPNSRKYKKGVCQVRSCATRPGVTEVGPCSVCKSCQAKFDNGEDPTKEPVARTTTDTAEKTDLASGNLFEFHDKENEARQIVEQAFAEINIQEVEEEAQKNQELVLAAV